MAVDLALDIFPLIQSLVSDKLQVVSYKWLSRNFSVSSNYSKRLLQEFAEKYNNELEVIYTLSGWLKSDPQVYHVELTSSLTLSEAKKKFQDGCSVQIYSVQACIPNDLAVLWNAEFVQAEELFNQPPTKENCLRDNRFCAVSNSFVKRIVDGKHAVAASPRPINVMGAAAESKSKNTEDLQPVQPPPQGLAGQSSAKIGMQTPNAVIGVKSDKIALEDVEKATKPPVPKEYISAVNINKRKGQNEKPSSGNTGSLSSFWGRASGKSKPHNSATETANEIPVAAVTAETQILVQEAADASGGEDDDHDINVKRESNDQSTRKRRVILDFSDDDDEENVVNLASPDLPIRKYATVSEPTGENLLMERKHMDSEVQKVDKLKDLQHNFEGKNTSFLSESDSIGGNKNIITGASLSDETGNRTQEGNDKGTKDNSTDSGATSPKRRKVLKMRTDDRGREVTEVVWEGETADGDKTEKNMMSNDAANRPFMGNKAQVPGSSVPTNQVNKGGSKKPAKGGPKDPKQGNILSFFKRV